MTVSPSLISVDVIVTFGTTVEILEREIVSVQAGRFSIVHIMGREPLAQYTTACISVENQWIITIDPV